MTTKEFWDKYCSTCGSQLCYGPCCEWADGCGYWRDNQPQDNDYLDIYENVVNK